MSAPLLQSPIWMSVPPGPAKTSPRSARFASTYSLARPPPWSAKAVRASRSAHSRCSSSYHTPSRATATPSSIRFRGEELIGAGERKLRAVRGNEIAMIFQEPMTSLNPLHRVEKQINETLLLHKGLSGTDARRRTLELLHMVGIREPEKRLSAYPSRAFRRPAPARDDRHGAGQRARPPDRR